MCIGGSSERLLFTNTCRTMTPKLPKETRMVEEITERKQGMSIKEEWKAKTDRLERARIKAEEFVAAGGDLKSEEAVPLGLEMLHAWNR
jgi:hypothetical protein